MSDEKKYDRVVFVVQLAIDNKTKAEAVKSLKGLVKAIVKADELEGYISLGVKPNE